MFASMKETSIIRLIRTFIAACLSILPGAKRPVDERASTDRKEKEPADREAIAPKKNALKDRAAEFMFLLSIICIALMILLGLAIPAIMMTGLCLLLIERRTRYRAALAGKVIPA
jgi:hypothetical protein